MHKVVDVSCRKTRPERQKIGHRGRL